MRPVIVLATTASVCVLALAAGSAGAASIASTRPAPPTAHVLRTHLDGAPAGVDVRVHVATAALVARSGASAHRAVYRVAPSARAPHGARLASGSAAERGAVVSVLSVPGGTAALAGMAEHVSPSCTGTTDGDRVQVLYVREASTPSRYTALLP